MQIYKKVFETAEKILGEATGLREATADAVTSNTGVAFTSLPWSRHEIVELADGELAVASGPGPFMKLRPFSLESEETLVTLEQPSPDVFVLQNTQLKVKLESGLITSLYDLKANREIIPKGQKANRYVIFDDKPLYWQAWDVEVFHLDSRKELSTSETKVHEQKKHRVSVITKTRISDKSYIETVISLSACSPSQQSFVEVSSKVEWHETMKFLKVEFPVDIRNTEASYETQFGIVRRPTHYNTSWDMAKFEVCSHRFADLSEHGYGVSVLNDCKYGFATSGNLMRLSLLRSSKAPDAHADMGTHHIRWGILPHQGGLSHVTVRKGYEFNNPLKIFEVESLGDVKSWLRTRRVWLDSESDEGLVLDTVKRGEDDEKTGEENVILRMYDSLGGLARGRVKSVWGIKRVTKVNLLEDEVEEVEVDGDGFGVELKAFEVATYKLELDH